MRRACGYRTRMAAQRRNSVETAPAISANPITSQAAFPITYHIKKKG